MVDPQGGGLRAIFLDAGGVLLDEQSMEVARAEATARFLGALVPEYSVERYWADTEEAVQAFTPETYLHVFWKYLKPDRVRCEEAYLAFRQEWRRARPPLELMPGIGDELRELAACFRVGLAGQYGSEVLDLLRREELLGCLAWHFTQDDFTLTKPDPRYLLQIAEACGVPPSECVMVGDRIDKDIVPARQVGMRTVRIRVGLHRNQRPRVPFEVPDVELESVIGLAEAVLGLA
ncbi:MAG: HAD family hydrolase [Planctomycetota bacterium]|jgi:putative hydrolase of the HAD superfamily